MQILLNNDEIIGYATIGGFVDGVDADIFESELSEFYPSKYLYINGKVLKNPNWVNPVDVGENARSQLDILQETVDMLLISELGRSVNV